MGTPINVIIDNKTVVDDLVSIEISQQERTYCNTVSLSLKSKNFWSLCDPTINFGELRITVVIGADTYQFLVEERDSTPSIQGVSFTVWGRSKQALLSKPYAKTINDTDDTTHPWQTGSTTATAIIAYVTSSYDVSVNWAVGDFIVYADSFSVSNQSPIDVISSLAQVVGAEITVNIDGSLSVGLYSVTEGVSVASYNDLDDIISLSESIDYPSGFNAVTVYGYGSDGGSIHASISAERVAAYPGDTMETIYEGRSHRVRVYYYHPTLMPVRTSRSSGAVASTTGGSETITEDVTLIFGKGSKSKTDISGDTEVSGDENIPITTVSVTYEVMFADFSIPGYSVTTTEDSQSFSIMFYFTDKSAYTVYSFNVSRGGGGFGGRGGGGLSSGQCSAVTVEKESPDTVIPGSEVLIRVYAAGRPGLSGSSGGDSPSFVTTDSEEQTENIIFTQGSASTAYPISSGQSPTYVWNGVYASPTYTYGESSLTVSKWADNLDRYSIPAKVTYQATYYVYKVTIPEDWSLPTFDVTFEWTDCGVHNLELTIDTSATGGGTNGDGTSDITINIKDYVTSDDIPGSSIYIDGIFKGNTDASGLLNVASVTVGDHTIKITATDYQDSDQDDLANDSFTVTS